MIMLTPKLYLFEIEPTSREEQMFIDCGCEFFVSMENFIDNHRDLIVENWRIENPESNLCTYTISDDRQSWVCDRGMRNPIGNDWENLLHFTLGFEQ